MRMPIVIAAVLAAFACLAPAQAGAAPSADAAAYCKAAGNIDAPDKAYTRPGRARLDGAGALYAARDQGAE